MKTLVGFTVLPEHHFVVRVHTVAKVLVAAGVLAIGGMVCLWAG